MIYRYMERDDINKLKRTNRVAYIVHNVQTKDISEYINCVLATLNNQGVDTNIFTIPRIQKLSNNYYNILLSARATVSNDNPNIIRINSLLPMLGNVISIYEL